jgi:chemotaxis protein MotA
MNYDDPHQVEEVLDKRMETHMAHALHSSHSLQTMADGLPALGIVAAVLGVIKTMGSIDQPPEILGKMIGGALVGTFLGVFLAYGLVGPFASRVKAVVEEDTISTS